MFTTPRVVSAICLALLCCPLGCAPSYTASDLDGTWVGRDYTINSRGHSLTSKKVTLAVDANGLITGSTAWTLLDGAGGNRGDAPVASDAEEIIGVFDPDSGEFYLVEMDESGFWRGRMLSRDRLQAFLVQSGPKPVAATIELQRAAD